MNQKCYRIPSRSEPGRYRTLCVGADGTLFCDCPAQDSKLCRHKRIYKVWKKEVEGNPEKCFYSGRIKNLDEHHLLRSADRPFSLTIWLNRDFHRLATYNKDFEEHLVHLFFDQEEIMEVKFQATIKEVSFKNLVSMDKGIKASLYSTEIDEAIKLAHLKHEKLVKISFPGDALWGIVTRVKKENMKDKDDRAEIVLEIAPGELIPAVKLATLDVSAKVEVEYTQQNE